MLGSREATIRSLGLRRRGAPGLRAALDGPLSGRRDGSAGSFADRSTRAKSAALGAKFASVGGRGNFNGVSFKRTNLPYLETLFSARKSGSDSIESTGPRIVLDVQHPRPPQFNIQVQSLIEYHSDTTTDTQR